MPTGYTAPVYNNRAITAKELAEGFARGLGFTIHQRDESADAPPSHREPGTRHLERLADLAEKRAAVLRLTKQELVERQRKEVAEAKAANEQSRIKHQSLESRYDYAISVFEAWSPDTEAGRRVCAYALDQLRESKRFDSGGAPYVQSIPEVVDPEFYRTELLDKIDRDIDYHQRNYDEEVERCREANRWIDDFYKDAQRLEGIRLDT